MTKLSREEKETIINFNEGEDGASIYTYNAGLKKRLAAGSAICWTRAVSPSVSCSLTERNAGKR